VKIVQDFIREHRSRALASLLLVALGGVVLAACSSSTVADPVTCGGSTPKLTVQGSGMATGTPNILTVTISVTNTGANAQSALNDDSLSAAAVESALTQGGVATKDIQTTGLTIAPNYVTVHNNLVQEGYNVTNSVVATLRNFSTAGNVIDAVATAGGNAVQIQSLNFSLEDPRPVQDAARNDAVHEAVSHAATMAASAGEALGPVCSLTDNSGVVVPQNQSDEMAALPEAAATSGTTVPLQAGTEQESAQVTMVYALKPRR
jgi:uncharacterized protein YggE